MEKDIRDKLIAAFLIFLSLLVFSITGIIRGIENNETWRIVLASIGGAGSVTFIILIIYAVVKNGRKAA
jgi:hypothetical protein